jgi:hypothetical protein
MIKSVTSKISTNEIIHQLNMDGGKTSNLHIISVNFNDYFLTVADKITTIITTAIK